MSTCTYIRNFAKTYTHWHILSSTYVLIFRQVSQFSAARFWVCVCHGRTLKRDCEGERRIAKILGSIKVDFFVFICNHRNGHHVSYTPRLQVPAQSRVSNADSSGTDTRLSTKVERTGVPTGNLNNASLLESWFVWQKKLFASVLTKKIAPSPKISPGGYRTKISFPPHTPRFSK